MIMSGNYSTYYQAIFQDFLYSLLNMDYLYRKEYAYLVNNRYLKQPKPKSISNAQRFIRKYDLTKDKNFPMKHQIEYDTSRITLRTILDCNRHIQNYISLINREVSLRRGMHWEFKMHLHNYEILNMPTREVKWLLIGRQKDYAESHRCTLRSNIIKAK